MARNTACMSCNVGSYQVGAHHHVAHAPACSVVQVGGDVLPPPHLGVVKSLKGLEHGVLAARLHIDVARNAAAGHPHPLGAEPLTDADGVVSGHPCHAVVGNDNEIYV